MTEVLVTLKVRTKSLGLSQSDLAKKLGISLPTLKRWFRGGTITLTQFKTLCDELGMSMSEVLASSEQSLKNQFQYTLEQERFLANHPDVLAFFDMLNRGQPPQKIQKKYSWAQARMEKALAALDRIDLIEWLPQNKVKLIDQGEPIWRENGPLAQKFKGQIINEFLKSVEKQNMKFMLHDYSSDDLSSIQAKLGDLIDFTTKANRRSQLSPEKSKSHGLYIALQPYSWSLENYLK